MARQLIQAVPMNASALSGGTFPSTPAAGIDAAGAGNAFATPWTGIQGVMFQNNGLVWLWYYNGTGAITADELIGQKAGGLAQPYTAQQSTLNVSGYGWLGPWSPSQYNQQDAAQFGSAPGGVIGTSGVGLMCVDFSATTNLAIRAYQIVQQN